MIYDVDKEKSEEGMHEIVKEAVNELERKINEAFPDEINGLISMESVSEKLKELRKIFYDPVEEFAKNPLDSDKIMQCVYKHIYIEDMEYTSNILGYCVLPCDVFEEYFELYMETSEINKKLRELGIE